MELTQIATEIQKKIADLKELRLKLPQYVQDKAETISTYDKVLGTTIIRLKNGQEFEIDGTKIKDPPTTIMEKIAKAICWEQRLAMERADGMYKAITSNIETLKAELNGLQSIFRHLDSN